jgi:hypothetical protein
MRGPELAPSPFPLLFRWGRNVVRDAYLQYEMTRANFLSTLPLLFRLGGKVARSAYLQYKMTRVNSLSITSPGQVGREGGERCLPAVRDDQS